MTLPKRSTAGTLFYQRDITVHVRQPSALYHLKKFRVFDIDCVMLASDHAGRTIQLLT